MLWIVEPVESAMNTNDLYLAAVSSVGNHERAWGAARHTLANGDVIICNVDAVAGASQVKRHFRTTWGRVPAGAQFSKTISRVKAVELLRGG